MKKIFVIIIILYVAGPLSAQLDRSQRPQPGPAPLIQLADFESFTLDNGLRVIVVENDKVPVVSFQLTLDIDPVMEGNAIGYVELGGSLLRDGTSSRQKGEIDEAIDFIGGNLTTYSTGIFASSLTRHTETLLDLMSDVLLNPSFPESELQRLIQQYSSALSNVRSDANSIARNVSTALTFGSDHPYGEVMTEESVGNITIDLIREYYNTYFKPNVAYMVIVGDITTNRARELMNSYFGSWEPGEVPTKSHPVPQPPDTPLIAFAERPGAVQSVVVVSHPVVLTPGHPDAIKVSVMNTLLGGGTFTGRLMQNLREDKGYTYGAGSSLGTDRLISRFIASTEVRNTVTDSTIVEILHEMRRLIDEPVKEEELSLTKNFMTGSFARSLENPSTIADFALNIKKYNLPDDYYATYLEKLSALTTEDVQEVAARYLKPDQVIIVVAGNMEEVPETLEKFNSTGEVGFYDAFGRPVKQVNVEISDDLTASQVIGNYVDARGGLQKMRQVNDLTTTLSAEIMGQQATIIIYKKNPNLMMIETILGGMTVSKQIFDGVKVIVTSPMGSQEFSEGPAFEQAKAEAAIFPELQLIQTGTGIALLGTDIIDEEGVVIIELSHLNETITYDYFSIETGLKVASMADPLVFGYSDYRDVDGIMFPFRIIQEAGGMSLELVVRDLKVNSGLTNDIFKP